MRAGWLMQVSMVDKRVEEDDIFVFTNIFYLKIENGQPLYVIDYCAIYPENNKIILSKVLPTMQKNERQDEHEGWAGAPNL